MNRTAARDSALVQIGSGPVPSSPALHALHKRFGSRRARLLALASAIVSPRRSGLFFPANTRNPYQAMLYSDRSIPFVPLAGLARLDRVPAAALPALFHLHWEDALLVGAEPDGVHDATEAAIARIKRLKAAGTKLIWTVHNYASHDDGGPEFARAVERLRVFLVAQSDLIHVHSEHASDYLQSTYGARADRIAVVPHPSYLEWYADLPRLRPLPARRRFLSFGFLRGYKGLDRLISAFAETSRAEQIAELHIAGPGTLTDRPVMAGRVPVTFSEGFVPEDDVPGLFAATDFAVFAHTRALTSGTVILSASLGVPPVVPAHPGIVEGLPPALAPLIFDPTDPLGLTRAVDYAATMPAGEYAALSAALIEHARDTTPSRQSRKFIDSVISHGLL